MDQRERERKAKHRLAILNHAEKISGNLAALTGQRSNHVEWDRLDRLVDLAAELGL